jgi:hypothetical protein
MNFTKSSVVEENKDIHTVYEHTDIGNLKKKKKKP